MTSLERIRRTLARGDADRAAYALWRHFPDEDRRPADLARATLLFHRRHGSDFIKVTFAGGYAVGDWGCVESEQVEADGHRPCARHAVNEPEDWGKIKPLDVRSGAYGLALDALDRVARGAPAGVPVVPTLFSPLSLARKLGGERLKEDLRARPEAVEEALEAIAETQSRFAAACLDRGAAGIFYSIQAASRRHHTEEEYRRFGEPHDRRILAEASARSTLCILHAHGDSLFFERLAGLPSHAVNWDDRSTGPPLADGKASVRGAVIGGLHQWKTLREGTPESVRAEVEDALRGAGRAGVIIGPGCVIPPDAPPENLDAVAAALG